MEHVVVSYSELFGFSLDQALDWKDDRDLSSCSMCGVFRRRAIDEAAVKAKVDVVATAHNLDDYVQTFMMNLLHGDVERLGWLDPSTYDDDFPVRRVKPLTEVYEEEVALYAYLSKIPFQSVNCPYMHEGPQERGEGLSKRARGRAPRDEKCVNEICARGHLEDVEGGPGRGQRYSQVDSPLREMRQALVEGGLWRLQDDPDSLGAQ